MLTFKLPEFQDENYLLEFLETYPSDGSWIAGTNSLNRYQDNLKQWIQEMQDYAQGNSLPVGRVPLLQYLAFADSRIVGFVNLRLSLNDYLLHSGGHIGYVVHPHYRQQGIAFELLQYALGVAQDKGIDKVLVTCADHNIASAKVIEKAGGQLEDKRLVKGVWVRRYWIDNKNDI
ncbi:GNAT family N-acetyltransferase [Facklamia lactis]|uniref:GNAT family N-acetyltransferase n=1 Tax=Facklamia lactis TaxID=2749967 RepID=UPI0018CD03C1|nr:GNAT family N-acetyltransferase [Facklamia lactis]MBG9980341.1 GNAT family N-acetyltransferase [Facklamia lactis]